MFFLLGSVSVLLSDASIERASPDLVFAYRHIALPIAITAGSLALIVTVWVEVRNYRLGKVLAAMSEPP